ncbi:hypothetical protein [Lacipirellula limnantheis]|uniref:PEP-CTERM protein-sorting domain-containing protein n=1 Tax=Lacipirellula limnantheis TaxID=2528024 RepID=A0A517U450_9BACT|nr:hypothetical protein [Lacipirellula limnantheis]QDT75375.1 hypothetical protein I41_45850 [Lacipirellula limnantheis]
MKATFLLCLFIGSAAVEFASGATTTTYFKGTIDQIASNDGMILGDLQIAQEVTGFFTFNDAPSEKLGTDRYRATIAINLSTRSLVVPSDYNYIRARNNQSIGGGVLIDEFSHGFDSIGPTTWLDPFYVYALSVRFRDTDANEFDSSPQLPVDLSDFDWESAEWSLSGADLATRRMRFGVSGSITAILVPEPTSAWVGTTLGLFAAGVWRRAFVSRER